MEVRIRFLGNRVFGDVYHGSDGNKSLDMAKGEERTVMDETAEALFEDFPGSFQRVRDLPRSEVKKVEPAENVAASPPLPPKKARKTVTRKKGKSSKPPPKPKHSDIRVIYEGSDKPVSDSSHHHSKSGVGKKRKMAKRRKGNTNLLPIHSELVVRKE